MKMKQYLLVGGFSLIIFGCSQLPMEKAQADSMTVVDPNSLGLSKGSVFDAPTPKPVSYSDSKPKTTKRLPKAYSTLPPQVGHSFKEYLPITLEDNECLDCHDKRKLLKRKWKQGKKLPMPDDHYGSFEKKGGVEDVAGARYNCTQCHVPQSDAPPLVENVFKN